MEPYAWAMVGLGPWVEGGGGGTRGVLGRVCRKHGAVGEVRRLHLPAGNRRQESHAQDRREVRRDVAQRRSTPTYHGGVARRREQAHACYAFVVRFCATVSCYVCLFLPKRHFCPAQTLLSGSATIQRRL